MAIVSMDAYFKKRQSFLRRCHKIPANPKMNVIKRVIWMATKMTLTSSKWMRPLSDMARVGNSRVSGPKMEL